MNNQRNLDKNRNAIIFDHLEEKYDNQFRGQLKTFTLVIDSVVLISGLFILLHNCIEINNLKGGVVTIICPVFGCVLSGIAFAIVVNCNYLVTKFYFMATYVGKSLYYLYITLQWMVINGQTIKGGWIVLYYEIIIACFIGFVGLLFYGIAYRHVLNEEEAYVPRVYLYPDYEYNERDH